jgi:ribosomal protein S18 acetylase RimI-like enzyme
MVKMKVAVKTRRMELDDIDTVFAIDHRVRAIGKAITYRNLTTERVFTVDRHVGRQAKPVSYVDLITGDISELLEFGFVAEVDGHVRGFILGRRSPSGGAAAATGTVMILGVHPDFRRQGIAVDLLQALGDRFREAKLKRIHVKIDYSDKDMLDFFERQGFGVGNLIDYYRKL